MVHPRLSTTHGVVMMKDKDLVIHRSHDVMQEVTHHCGNGVRIVNPSAGT